MSINEVLAWLALIVLAIVGWEIYVQFKALTAWFQGWLHISEVASGGVAWRFCILATIAGVALYRSFFLSVLPFLPVAIVIVFIPALDDWARGYVMTDANNIYVNSTAPAWYGVWWVQAVSCMLFGAAGLYVLQKSES